MEIYTSMHVRHKSLHVQNDTVLFYLGRGSRRVKKAIFSSDEDGYRQLARSSQILLSLSDRRGVFIDEVEH